MPLVQAVQVKMARAGLGWSMDDLAKASGVHRTTIANFEAEIFDGDAATLRKLKRALEATGVQFLDGKMPGVRVKR